MDNLPRGFAHRREVDWTRGVGAASRRLTRAAVEGQLLQHTKARLRPAPRFTTGLSSNAIVGDAGGVACAGRAIGVAVGGSWRVVGALTTAPARLRRRGARAAEFARGVPAEPVAEASALERVRAGVFFTLPDALPRGPHNLTREQITEALAAPVPRIPERR